MPETAQHVLDAQLGNGSNLAPAPILLHAFDRTGNREWYNKEIECLGKAPGEACDEYPFYKTNEGGPERYPGRVSLRLAPRGEQHKQGGVYGAMLSSCKIKKTKTKTKSSSFLAVGIPDAGIPSGFACIGNKK